MPAMAMAARLACMQSWGSVASVRATAGVWAQPTMAMSVAGIR